MPKEEVVNVGGRVRQSTKELLDLFCKGEIDGEKHIQEDVIDKAIVNYVEHRKKFNIKEKL